MKALIPLSLLAASMLYGCKGNNNSDVSSLSMSMDLMNARQFYMATTAGGDTAYYDVQASIQWPREVGKADLTPLCDSILAFAFGNGCPGEVGPAMQKFVEPDSSALDDVVPGAKWAKVDEIPYNNLPYYQTVTGRLLEVSDRFVSYSVTNSFFQGGPHGFSTVFPFTYDLENSAIVSLGYLFRKGTLGKVAAVVAHNLESDNGMEPGSLEENGITIPADYPGQPYIVDGMLVFHFDPYEIASYAQGAFDIRVYPGEVERYLTPKARTLLSND